MTRRKIMLRLCLAMTRGEILSHKLPRTTNYIHKDAEDSTPTKPHNDKPTPPFTIAHS
ncbi:hypothetical protein [Helicobacter sp.]|uniref:hypothetical protein n=1 Tax=Helicobacter sp. TaxID=218 RepID=UPI00198AE87F|nr:hypothetical protein [Helicobacter sp.]MBD5165962.1 hypothetical protein [Helicobacter sp.]